MPHAGQCSNFAVEVLPQNGVGTLCEAESCRKIQSQTLHVPSQHVKVWQQLMLESGNITRDVCAETKHSIM